MAKKKKKKTKQRGRDRYERKFESFPREPKREKVIDRYMDALFELRLAACALYYHSAEQHRPSRCVAEFAVDKVGEIELRSGLKLKPEVI